MGHPKVSPLRRILQPWIEYLSKVAGLGCGVVEANRFARRQGDREAERARALVLLFSCTNEVFRHSTDVCRPTASVRVWSSTWRLAVCHEL